MDALDVEASLRLQNDFIFIAGVDGAEPVLSVGDHDPAVGFVADQKDRRKGDSIPDLQSILFDLMVADAEQRQPRGTEICPSP